MSFRKDYLPNIFSAVHLSWSCSVSSATATSTCNYSGNCNELIDLNNVFDISSNVKSQLKTHKMEADVSYTFAAFAYLGADVVGFDCVNEQVLDRASSSLPLNNINVPRVTVLCKDTNSIE